MATTLLLWAYTWPGSQALQGNAWLCGLLAVYCAFALHEWGHVLGARISHAQVYPARSLWTPFIYHFDAQANDSRQFLITSVVGFAATGLFLCAYLWWLPDFGAGLVAQRGALLLAALTVIFEFPIAIAVALGKPIPELSLVTPQPTPTRSVSLKDASHD